MNDVEFINSIHVLVPTKNAAGSNLIYLVNFRMSLINVLRYVPGSVLYLVPLASIMNSL
jgi:hypothetical protein